MMIFGLEQPPPPLSRLLQAQRPGIVVTAGHWRSTRPLSNCQPDAPLYTTINIVRTRVSSCGFSNRWAVRAFTDGDAARQRLRVIE